MSIGEIIGFFVFCGIVLAFIKYKFDANPIAWAWDHIKAGFSRIGK